MDEDEICEIADPKKFTTGEKSKNGKAVQYGTPGELKKLPFSLIIKKETARFLSTREDGLPNYAVNMRFKDKSPEQRSLFDYLKTSDKLTPKKEQDVKVTTPVKSMISNTSDPQSSNTDNDTTQGHNSDENTSRSQSIFDHIKSSELLSTKQERDCDVAAPSSNLPVTCYNINGSIFKPTHLTDISKLSYCTFCFTSDDNSAHETKHLSCPLKDYDALQSEYWPNGWPNVQTLSFRFYKCAFVGCKAEFNESWELLEHIKVCQQKNSPTLSEQSQERTSDSSRRGNADGCSDDESDSQYYDCSNTVSDEDTAADGDENTNLIGSDGTEHQTIKDDHSVEADKFDPDMFEDAKLSNDQMDFEETNAQPNTVPATEALKPYKCGFCHSMTHNVKIIMQHYFHRHNINSLFICEKCNFVSHQKKSLYKHWSRYHFKNDPMPKPIIVEEDSYDDTSMMKRPDLSVENSTESIPEHSLEAYNEFLKKSACFRINCKLCDYYTKTLINMRHHITTKHITVISETLINMIEDTTAYRCVTCKTVTKTKKTMATHYVGEHLKTKKIECGVCEKSLCDMNQLEKHCGTDKHADQYRRSIRCRKCLYATLTKAKLQKHAAEHAPQFRCSECNFKTKVKSRLHTHMMASHQCKKSEDGLYWCEAKDCGFSTKIQVDIVHHRRICPHSNNYTGTLIPCDYCDFVAASQLGIVHHMKRHKDIVGENSSTQ